MYIEKAVKNKSAEDMLYIQKFLSQHKVSKNKGESKEVLYQDKVSISSEGKTLFDEKENSKKINGKNPIIDNSQSLMEMIEDLRKQSEQKDDSANDLLKCIKIASRIINGHKVPLKDERFLAEKQLEMYLKAIMLRRQNKNPKEYKSVSKDDKKNSEEYEAALQGISEESISIDNGQVSLDLELF